jgi:uncharacterized protein DUF3306
MKPGGSGASPASERFLTRWSRLKRTGTVPAETTPAPTPPTTVAAVTSTPAPAARDMVPAAAHTGDIGALPPIDSLSIESDFAPFFQPKVPEALRRAAVKKLFADPRFNVMDGLDVYIDDYSKADPIPPEMLKMLNHARDLIDHPSNRIEREQAAAHGDGTANGVEQSAAAVEPKPGAGESEAPGAAQRNDDPIESAAAAQSPEPADTADRSNEPAGNAAQSPFASDRPAGPR